MKNNVTKVNTQEINNTLKPEKNSGEAIVIDSEGFDEVFAEIKVAVDGVKSVFSKLKDKMDHNDIEEISKKAEHLGKLLENNEIIGRQVKTASNIAIDLAKDVLGLGNAILAGRFDIVPTAATDIAIDLLYAGKSLVHTASSFKNYYKVKLKPKFAKMREKIDKQEEKMKDEFKHLREKLNLQEEKIKGELKHLGQVMDGKFEGAGHWLEKKLNTKDKSSKKKQIVEIDGEKELTSVNDSEILVKVNIDIE